VPFTQPGFASTDAFIRSNCGTSTRPANNGSNSTYPRDCPESSDASNVEARHEFVTRERVERRPDPGAVIASRFSAGHDFLFFLHFFFFGTFLPFFAVAIFLMSAIWLGAKGAVSADTIQLFLIGLRS
jgi:hypothetical protein